MSKLPTYDDLMKASRQELLTLTADLERALKDSEAKVRNDTLRELRRVAQENGYDLQDFLGSSASAKGSSGKAAPEPKYRHPENSALTWSGRGRQPDWIKSHVEGGGSKDDFAI